MTAPAQSGSKLHTPPQGRRFFCWIDRAGRFAINPGAASCTSGTYT